MHTVRAPTGDTATGPDPATDPDPAQPTDAQPQPAIAPIFNKGGGRVNQQQMPRERLATAANAVFSNQDLVASILTNNVGPVAFSTASQINRTARRVCRTSLPLLKSVAFYTEALTTTQFRGLFALKAAEAAALPHEDRKRFRLYRKPAIDAVLSKPGVMARIARELPAHGDSILYYQARDAVHRSPPRTFGAPLPAFHTPPARSRCREPISGVKRAADREAYQREQFLQLHRPRLF